MEKPTINHNETDADKLLTQYGQVLEALYYLMARLLAVCPNPQNCYNAGDRASFQRALDDHDEHLEMLKGLSREYEDLIYSIADQAKG